MCGRLLLTVGILAVLMIFPVTGQAETDYTEAEAEALVEQQTDIRPEVDPFAINPYQTGDLKTFGEMFTHTVGEQDTLHDIARHYNIGFVELRAANPGVDAWAPPPGTDILIPAQHLLPRAPQKGIVINLSEMRLYYFAGEQQTPITHPLGIGREGLETPLGTTKVVRKTEGPSWHPTPRMREENPDLPWRVPPGAANPLGSHALYLGWSAFLIHGTNKPWGMGRRVSSGCIRMYPEDIVTFFGRIPVGTQVTVIEQPVKTAVVDDALYMEVVPTGQAVYDIELTGLFDMDDETTALPEDLEILIRETVGARDLEIDWDLVNKAWREKKGYPIQVGGEHPALAEQEPSSSTPLYLRPKTFNQ